jgi:poly [ADP-ribose] polymerase 6/8
MSSAETSGAGTSDGTSEDDGGEAYEVGFGSVDFVLTSDPPPVLSILPGVCSTMEAVLPRFQFAVLSATRFQIKIPSLVLPSSLAAVNHFDTDPVLLDVVLDLQCNSLDTGVTLESLSHPVFGTNFPGRPLVQARFDHFFSPFDPPTPSYRSALYVLEPTGEADGGQVAELVASGFREDVAARALILTRGDLAAARDYLVTGTTTAPPPEPVFARSDCPVLYLILELVDGFLDLMDHCCCGGEPLGISGLKPSTCDRPLCVFGMASLGVGSSVVSELRRDPVVADFIVSLASAAYGTKLFVPPLSTKLIPPAAMFFQLLPPISHMTRFDTDQALRAAIGAPQMDILRFLLFTNRCHLIHLPGELAIAECGDATEQFLCVVATPEKELTFQRKRDESGVAWLWHGAPLDRWHSILHTGLQDLGATGDRTHLGSDTYGPGVYQSNQSSVSIWYATRSGEAFLNENNYKHTSLPAKMRVLALCENVKGPQLAKVADAEFTQQDLDGLIVRCLMVVKNDFAWDPYEQPPKRVPSLHDCLAYLGQRGH